MSDEAAHRKAEEAHGIITRDGALEAGLSTFQIRRRVELGVWERTASGVYRVVGAPKTWRRDLEAIARAAGEEAAVSHRAAAELHGLRRYGQAVEVTTPRTRRYRLDEEADSIVHRHRDLVPDDVVFLEGLPVTSVARTLLDLGAVVRDHQVEYCLDAAIRDKKVTLGEVHRLLQARRKRGRRGAGVLARVLDGRDRAVVPESSYERDFLRLIGPAGIPAPVAQYKVLDERGVIVARADFAWPQKKVILEIDGHAYHATRGQRAHDAERQNRLIALGWTVLRMTTDQVYKADPATLAIIRSAVS